MDQAHKFQNPIQPCIAAPVMVATNPEPLAVSRDHLESWKSGRKTATINGITSIVQQQLLVLLLLTTWQSANAQDCTLVVPANPLTAKGLATPYLMSGCDMANGSPSFVECAVFNPGTNQISLYHPLVINQGTKPAFPTVTPNLPANAVVGCWFGTNGATLTLQSAPGTNSLAQGKCVNGLPTGNGQVSIFGQFAYCNAPAFFSAVNAAKITIPALGNDPDGKPCPTTREFAVVDQDQSDNVDTMYLLTQNGQTAQFTKANQSKCQGCTILTNGSDNRLVEVMDGVLKCPQFTGNVLEDPGTQSPALALNELLAAARQGSPAAIVPDGHAMCLVNGMPNQQKRNLYRVGVNQDPKANGDTKTYCRNLANIAPTRFRDDWQKFYTTQPSPAADVGNNLYNFICARYQAAFGADNLNCVGLLGIASPITVNVDNFGVATGCIINPVQV